MARRARSASSHDACPSTNGFVRAQCNAEIDRSRDGVRPFSVARSPDARGAEREVVVSAAERRRAVGHLETGHGLSEPRAIHGRAGRLESARLLGSRRPERSRSRERAGRGHGGVRRFVENRSGLPHAFDSDGPGASRRTIHPSPRPEPWSAGTRKTTQAPAGPPHPTEPTGPLPIDDDRPSPGHRLDPCLRGPGRLRRSFPDATGLRIRRAPSDRVTHPGSAQWDVLLGGRLPAARRRAISAAQAPTGAHGASGSGTATGDSVDTRPQTT